nr:TOBE domain-containing protein [Pararhizobium antarcticum]
MTLSPSAFTTGFPIRNQAVTLCIRPEHFRRAGTDEVGLVTLGQASVTGQAFFGTHYRCHLSPLAAPQMSIVAHMPQSATVSEGEAVGLAVSALDVVVLPSQRKDA